MRAQRTEEEDGGLTIEALGAKARATGRETQFLVLIVVLFAGVAYLLWTHDKESKERTARMEKVLEAMVYATLAPEDERRRLYQLIAKPDYLREQERKQLRGE